MCETEALILHCMLY